MPKDKEQDQQGQVPTVKVKATGFEESYYQHENWFKIGDILKPQKGAPGKEIRGVRIVNSYGKVREIYENGDWYQTSNGNQKNFEDKERIEIVG